MARRVQSSGRTGWYYRVLQPGTARAGEVLRLDARPYPAWTLSRLGMLLFGRALARQALEPALQLPLVPSWRKLLERRLQLEEVEDWSRRLEGPDRH
jgi:MOSC domain-containing protein YiiM